MILVSDARAQMNLWEARLMAEPHLKDYAPPPSSGGLIVFRADEKQAPTCHVERECGREPK
jgi:hypothetical protein